MAAQGIFLVECVRAGDGWAVADAAGGSTRRSEATWSEEGLVLFCDARIDDRASICPTLGLPIDAPAPQIIAAAYRAWGDSCAGRLLGDFAYVIIDTVRREIFAARDFAGVRPLYLHHSATGLAFSNDLEALVDRLPEPPALDKRQIATIIAGKDAPFRPETGFQGIERLPQAHWRKWQGNAEQSCEYWNPHLVPRCSLHDDDAVIAEGRRLLELAVSDRMSETRKTAVHVSGGLDSSTIAALVQRQAATRALPKPLGYAWYGASGDTANSPDMRSPEVQWVAAMADSLDMPIHVPGVSEADVEYLLRADGLRLIEPGILIYETGIMAHAAQHGIDTVFSGWGGDQAISFNGKGHRAALLLSLRWRELAQLGDGPTRGWWRGIRKAMRELLPHFPAYVWRKKLRKSYLAKPGAPHTARSALIGFHAPGVRPRMARLLANFGISERMETWAKAGRTNGLTYVYPLLDRRLVEFALSLPGHMFVRPGVRRWIFRQIAEPVLPDLVRTNDSKKEPNRVAALASIFHPIFRKLAIEIRHLPKTDERTSMIDTDQLARNLSGNAETVLERLFAKRQAIQFLDLGRSRDRG